MKKRIPFPIVMLAFSFLLFTGCKKDKDSTTKTKTELITQGNWKFSSATLGGADMTGSVDDCEKDNLMSFVAAGTGNVDEGPTKCDPGDPQSNPFTWNFLSNETIIHVSTFFFTGDSGDLTLVTLSESQLIVSQSIDMGGGIMQTAQVTFTH